MKRNLFKKLNRGILLGTLLLVGIILYVSLDTVSFQTESKQIEQSIREYVEQSPQMAILPPPYNKIGSEAGETDISKKMEENEAFLRKYWSFRPDGQGYNQGEVMLSQVRTVVEHNAQGQGMITSAKGIVQYVHTVQKIGFGRAEVSFSYTGSIKYTGDVQWILFGTSRQNSAAAQQQSRGFLGQAEGKVTPSGDVTAVLVKSDGVWKIDSVEVSSLSVN